MFEVLGGWEVEGKFGVGVEFGELGGGWRGEEVRCFVGDLVIDDDLVSDFVDHPVHHVVVDGDLTVRGDLDWAADGFGVFFLVTGDLRVRNVLLHGGVGVAVRGALDVRGVVVGAHEGEGAGFLRVHGDAGFGLAVATGDFRLDFRGETAGPVAVAGGATVLGVAEVREAGELLDPGLLDRAGRPLAHELADCLRSGRPLFL
ncbi:hypothetical protein [Actinocorallia sp. A-T 12471]|uniref:hypothetical protein n=1 Tax=Actinocorallia sp. A-T 12471 TaxID=3089813 RepID=UPI0029D3E44C|nr:hypothetical protein [Actinocorallia sp. A-T 12471]MDX6744390.1 hypothetical protein [Actinocorallia sp. A-T 12471]